MQLWVGSDFLLLYFSLTRLASLSLSLRGSPSLRPRFIRPCMAGLDPAGLYSALFSGCPTQLNRAFSVTVRLETRRISTFSHPMLLHVLVDCLAVFTEWTDASSGPEEEPAEWLRQSGAHYINGGCWGLLCPSPLYCSPLSPAVACLLVLLAAAARRDDRRPPAVTYCRPERRRRPD